ncbi:acyltransferase [Pseudoalteromonas sp. NBT06-2]|uniref:1-acyl-sn-glycerol-3-phosphate acyltransferase n=1 Tax=Pseudoalteromonas sp. NBT06-2 TaxID=2025950 RepID=UPI000BA5BE45|nr:1-acyl-sn-glycerol-3-phosphate acyltransferase [Pseudoalteromonas sp. NBT06-2]PAJ75809.1 acyltransferase [Pseudoalteromonas sp. NBT06-2]
MSQKEDKFADIRPYNDSEVPAALRRLINDDDFINLIAKHNIPKWLSTFSFITKPLLKKQLAKKWLKLNTVEKLQNEVSRYLGLVIKKTTSQVTFSGLDKLDKTKSYLFISNHRDIALDPALLNWGMFSHNMSTVRIAIGDNLLQVPYITELMRLNKSFIVKRSIKAPKEMFKALNQLSAYIFDSIDTGNSVWIAQKEGRAKDGNDYTDPALLKMIQLQGRKQKLSFEEYVQKLNLVPVSISYQFEPCDIAKANERYHKNKYGEYQKQDGEDMDSIMEGFRSNKGHVHLAFGQPIFSGCGSPEELAQTIDQQILSSFYLHPGNYIAANHNVSDVSEPDKKQFAQRMAQVPDELKEIVLGIYAKPLEKQLKQL